MNWNKFLKIAKKDVTNSDIDTYAKDWFLNNIINEPFEYYDIISNDIIKKPKKTDTIFPLNKDIYSVDDMMIFDKNIQTYLKKKNK